MASSPVKQYIKGRALPPKTKSVSPKKKINNGTFFQEQGLMSFAVAYARRNSLFLEIFYEFLVIIGESQAQLINLMINQV